jgi:hypothetical protein
VIQIRRSFGPADMAGLCIAERLRQNIWGETAEFVPFVRLLIHENDNRRTEKYRIDPIEVVVVSREDFDERPPKVRRRAAWHARTNFFDSIVVAVDH